MKKIFLAVFLVLLFTACDVVSAQCCPYVNIAKIIPLQPNTTSNIQLITQVATPSQGSKISDMLIVSTNPNEVKYDACYYLGMATSPKSFNDTMTVGQLPAGVYSLELTFYASTTPVSCNASDTQVVKGTFTVINTTSLLERKSEESFQFYPNPVIDVLKFNSPEQVTMIMIFNYAGQILREIQPGITGQIDMSFLNEGIYQLCYTSGEKNYFTRLVKVSPE